MTEVASISVSTHFLGHAFCRETNAMSDQPCKRQCVQLRGSVAVSMQRSTTEKSGWADLHTSTLMSEETKKDRKNRHCYEIQEGRKLKNEDLLSQNVRFQELMLKKFGKGDTVAHDDGTGLLRMLHQDPDTCDNRCITETPKQHPQPCFKAGQSVLQWWASWFKDATEAPRHYAKNRRPSWFSAEICSPGVWVKDMRYAGMNYTGFAYPAH